MPPDTHTPTGRVAAFLPVELNTMPVRRVLFIGLFLTVFLVFGCDSQSSMEADAYTTAAGNTLTEQERAALEQQGLVAGKGGYAISQAPVLTIADNAQVGRSRLVRHRDGVLATIQTSGLEPGTATTLWLVVFNAPEHCSDGACGSDDFTNPDVRADLLWADGRVIGPSGHAEYFVARHEGDTFGSIADPLLGSPAYGIEDAERTEIHFVVRTHGPVIPGFEYEMTHTFNGCCRLGSLPDDPRLGPVGPNTCANLQFALHLPPRLRSGQD